MGFILKEIEGSERQPLGHHTTEMGFSHGSLSPLLPTVTLQPASSSNCHCLLQ